MIRAFEFAGAKAAGIPGAPADPAAVFASLEHLEASYPGFRAWYFGKVVSGVPAGTRQLFACYSHGKVLGVAIAKRGEERKLCTLWVHRDARVSGVAKFLASEAFDWLGTRHPLFTVPAERLPEFKGLLNGWGFRETSKVDGYYRDGSVEHIFNDDLRAHLVG